MWRLGVQACASGAREVRQGAAALQMSCSPRCSPLQVGRGCGPAQGGKGPEAGGEPGVQHVAFLQNQGPACGGHKRSCQRAQPQPGCATNPACRAPTPRPETAPPLRSPASTPHPRRTASPPAPAPPPRSWPRRNGRRRRQPLPPPRCQTHTCMNGAETKGWGAGRADSCCAAQPQLSRLFLGNQPRRGFTRRAAQRWAARLLAAWGAEGLAGRRLSLTTRECDVPTTAAARCTSP